MGKKKQQKQYRLNKKKGNEVADEMKIIMNQLAENKIKNVKMVERLVAITDINQVKKKIKKERKIKRLGHRGKDVENV